jgi:lipopolysaccharide export system protein LptA
VSAPARGADGEGTAKGEGLDGLRSDAPISIKSDELDVLQKGQGRRFLFKGHVRAEQDQLTLRSDLLEAEYPEGDGQPDRLVATGHVEMTHAGRKALCDRAVYYRREQRLVCTGNAQLEQACDRVRGEEIVFHVDSEVLEVNGAADVRIHPKGAACPADGAGS